MPRKHGRYSHPGIAIQHPLVTKRTFRPGDIVEHVSLPGVGLKIITGPHEGISGTKYYVEMPDGKVVPVLGRNLKG